MEMSIKPQEPHSLIPSPQAYGVHTSRISFQILDITPLNPPLERGEMRNLVPSPC